jgi:hypothetical protein
MLTEHRRVLLGRLVLIDTETSVQVPTIFSLSSAKAFEAKIINTPVMTARMTAPFCDVEYLTFKLIRKGRDFTPRILETPCVACSECLRATMVWLRQI